MVLLPSPQKFNTFNIFNTFNTFDQSHPAFGVRTRHSSISTRSLFPGATERSSKVRMPRHDVK